MVELRFRSQPNLLAIAAEEYFYKQKKEVALAIVKRNKLEQLLTKPDIKLWLESEEAASMLHQGLVANEVETLDSFGPYKGNQGPVSEVKTSKPCVTLEKLGYTEASIIHVKDSAGLANMIAEILKQKRVGIDIETTPVVLKFTEHEPSLLQLAIPGKIYLADFLASAEFGKELFNTFVQQICQNDTLLKIGQGLDNDIKTLKKKFDVQTKVVRTT
jgi:3'-5' exonuclease